MNKNIILKGIILTILFFNVCFSSKATALEFKKEKPISSNAYISYLLLDEDNIYSQETFVTEFNKLMELYKLTTNPFDGFFYLRQAILLSFKYHRYTISLTLLNKFYVDVKKDVQNPELIDYLNKLKKIIKQLTTEYSTEKELLQQIIDRDKLKGIKEVYYDLFHNLGEDAYIDLFYLYLYTFQFEKCQILLNNIYPSYFTKRDTYYNLQNILDRYVVLFADMYIPNLDFYSLINANFINNKKIELTSFSVKYISMYKKNISQSQKYYKEKFIKRLSLMETLLPYLHVIGNEKDFKNLYLKVVTLNNGRIPSNLKIENTNFNLGQLKDIYQKALGNTINVALYELYNNIDITKASIIIDELKRFKPEQYIGNTKDIEYGSQAYQ